MHHSLREIYIEGATSLFFTNATLITGLCSFINSTATEECKMINTTHKIPALFHYDIKLKHTFSQLLQQEIFLNSTQTKIKTTSCQILPSATIPAWAPMPTGFQIPPAFAHTLPTAPRRHPRTTTSPKFTSPSSHKRHGIDFLYINSLLCRKPC